MNLIQFTITQDKSQAGWWIVNVTGPNASYSTKTTSLHEAVKIIIMERVKQLISEKIIH